MPPVARRSADARRRASLPAAAVMSPSRPLAPASSRQLARASESSSPSTVRARVEVRDDGTASTTARFMWPIGARDTVRDVRERLARVVRRLANGAGDDDDDERRSEAREVTLDVDGYALLDESSARDVVRDDDVVRARWGRGREGGEGTRATIGDVLKRPLAPPVSDEEGEPNAGVEGERRDGGRSRSARRKSNKRARRREEYQTIEDLQVMSEDGEERDAEDAGRREEERWPSPLKILPGDPWKTTYAPKPLPDYDAKPKPKELVDYRHIGEYVRSDPESELGREMERRAEFERSVRESGEDVWVVKVFRCEIPDEEVEEFPLVTSLKRSDIIAYRLIERGGRRTPYYQGRVMHYDDDASLVRLKPSREERVTVAGELFFKMNKPAPKPFSKLGELETTWLLDPADDGADASQTGCVTEVRLIGGRSAWEGDVPHKTWSAGRVYAKPKNWQPGQRETTAEHEAWLTEHIRIHERQMANARKWDERIARGAHEHRNAGGGRRRPHRDEREQRRRDEENEIEAMHRWPTSAEELQAKLLADWQAQEAAAAATTLAPAAAAPKPGGLPPTIPGVVVPSSTKTIDDQPPPPPGSPPSEPSNAAASEKSSKDARATRRRARASTAAAMATFRSSGDIE